MACYVRPLHWQGEQRPPSNQVLFGRQRVTSPAAFAARHRFFPGSRVHRQRRGKCHGILSTFSRSRPLVLVVILPGDFSGMDG
jgi:hypothetical protein